MRLVVVPAVFAAFLGKFGVSVYRLDIGRGGLAHLLDARAANVRPGGKLARPVEPDYRFEEANQVTIS